LMRAAFAVAKCEALGAPHRLPAALPEPATLRAGCSRDSSLSSMSTIGSHSACHAPGGGCSSSSGSIMQACCFQSDHDHVDPLEGLHLVRCPEPGCAEFWVDNAVVAAGAAISCIACSRTFCSGCSGALHLRRLCVECSLGPQRKVIYRPADKCRAVACG